MPTNFSVGKLFERLKQPEFILLTVTGLYLLVLSNDFLYNIPEIKILLFLVIFAAVIYFYFYWSVRYFRKKVPFISYLLKLLMPVISFYLISNAWLFYQIYSELKDYNF